MVTEQARRPSVGTTVRRLPGHVRELRSGGAHLAFRRVFFWRTENVLLQMFRYLFVGGSAAIVDLATLLMLNHGLGVHYLWATFLAFLAGTLVNYLLSIGWVFRASGHTAEIVLFVLVGLVGLGLTEGLMWTFVGGLKLDTLVAKLLAMAVVVLWSFFARRQMFIVLQRRVASAEQADRQTMAS